MAMKKVSTLCLVRQGDQLLLGMKKRGFGQGRWNGFGGKVQTGETIAAAAIRECQEEAGITLQNLRPCAVLHFHMAESGDFLEVHVFISETFSGQPHETEEMRPQWFAIQAIPYDTMWSDDIHWLPLVLAGKTIAGTFWFADDKTLLRHILKEQVYA